jgi:hypothetical protein
MASEVSLAYTHKVMTEHGPEGLGRWKAPVEGVYLGPIVACEGATLEELARTGLTASASLVERLADAGDESAERALGLTTNKLEELVKAKVIAIRPALEPRFRVKWKIQENARAAYIGFIGDRIAANFGMLIPGRLSSHVDYAKAKLWDLAQLREDVNRKRDMFSQSIRMFELQIYRPREEAPEYSATQLNNVAEALVELEAEADKVEIRCRAATQEDEIANTLLLAEAA